jgi:hypothetical protein
MSPKHTEELISLFPGLFPSGSFCFDCGDGWFNIIKECILGLKRALEEHPPFIEGESLIYATQVKEKHGTLRFYTSLTTDRMDEIIDEAEKKSANICEACGEPGLLFKEDGWLYTRCIECKC